jgi:CHAT domain-containing protein/tetratricopeptide (TPR) repeat protein
VLAGKRPKSADLGGMWAARVVISLLCLLLLGQSVFGDEPAVTKKSPALSTSDRKKLIAERDAAVDRSQDLRGQGKLAEAIAARQTALEIERRVFGDVSDETAESLDVIGSCQLERDDFAEARKTFEQTRDILARLHPKNHWRLIDARLELEDVQLREHLTPAARRELAAADQVDVQALASFEKGKFGQSIKQESQALEIRRRILGEENPTTANSRIKLATLYARTGEFSKAEKLSLDSLKVSRKIKGNLHPDTAQNLNVLAGLYEDMDEYAKAEPLYLEALSIFSKVNGEMHSHTSVCMNDLAMLYQSMGQYSKAEPLFQNALAIHKQVRGEKDSHTAVCMNNLAQLYRDMGEDAKAEPLFRQALAIEKEAFGADDPLTGTTLNNLASLYTSMGDTAKAEPLLKQAIELHTKSYGEFHPFTASSIENLAFVYETLNDDARAEPLYRRALAIDRKVLGEGHPTTARLMGDVAWIERSKGNYAQAEALYRQALAAVQKAVGGSHVATIPLLDGLALVYEAKGEFSKEEPLLRQALDTCSKIHGEKHPTTANLLHNLAFMYNATGESQKAEPFARRALEIREEYFASAIRAQSERRQLALAHRFRSSLDAYLTFTANGNARDEYRHVLGWKGAVFMGQLAARAMRHRPDLKQLFEDLEVISVRLSTLAMRGPKKNQRVTWERQIAELSDRKEELERDLSGKSDEFRREKSLLQMDPSELQRCLPPNVALIDFLEYRHTSLPPKGKGIRVHQQLMAAFVVRRDRPIERFELGPVDVLSAAIDAWRKNIQLDLIEPAANAPSARFPGPPEQFLKQRLWMPLKSSLAGATTVLVSPDGVLNQIPLAALPGEKPGTYLIEELTLVNVPVPRLLPFLLKKPKPNAPEQLPGDRSLLLVGNVQYGGDPGRSDGVLVASRKAVRGAEAGELAFVELPGFVTESATIQDSFKEEFRGGAFKMLGRDKATEAAFRQAAPHYRYMHLATHGFFAPREVASALSPTAESSESGPGALGREGIRGYHPGLLSGVALSGANAHDSKGGDDGILTAVEVADLDLERTELVVLSACETGRGETAGGEGVLGLQRAFQIAGAKNVVASLWVIDDEATVALMRLFYHKLWNEKKPPATALREAQLALLHHPEQIKSFATRGPNFSKLADLPDGGIVKKGTLTASPRLWAAFVIAGPGFISDTH